MLPKVFKVAGNDVQYYTVINRQTHNFHYLLVRTLKIEHCISVMSELIVEILFMLSFAYNTVKWAENQWIQNIVTNGFSAI